MIMSKFHNDCNRRESPHCTGNYGQAMKSTFLKFENDFLEMRENLSEARRH